MKYIRFVVWAVAICLIALLCVLASGVFADVRVLILDGVVLACAVTMLGYAYGLLFASSEDFSRSMPSVGVAMPAARIYASLAIVGIVVGLVLNIPFLWQLFGQLCFLFVAVLSLLSARASAARLNQVEQLSNQRQQPREQLAALALQLQTASLSNPIVGDARRAAIGKLVERVGYISPSSTTAAIGLENQLSTSLKQLLQLLSTSAPAGQIDDELERAQQLLTQRIRTY